MSFNQSVHRLVIETYNDALCGLLVDLTNLYTAW